MTAKLICADISNFVDEGIVLALYANIHSKTATTFRSSPSIIASNLFLQIAEWRALSLIDNERRWLSTNFDRDTDPRTRLICCQRINLVLQTRGGGHALSFPIDYHVRQEYVVSPLLSHFWL